MQPFTLLTVPSTPQKSTTPLQIHCHDAFPLVPHLSVNCSLKISKESPQYPAWNKNTQSTPPLPASFGLQSRVYSAGHHVFALECVLLFLFIENVGCIRTSCDLDRFLLLLGKWQKQTVT